jgi:hypothetical protein
LKFIEFWGKLENLLRTKSDFVTLEQHKPFEAKLAIEAVAVTSDTIKDKRIIKKEEFHKIWFLSKDLSESEAMKPGSYQKNTLNASYIVTLIDAVLNP